MSVATNDAFRNVKVMPDDITVAAEIVGDTLTLVAGSGISLTADTDLDKITVTNTMGDGAWTSYVPTWTTAGTQPVIGNGTITGKYKQIGKIVFVRVRIQFGTTTSAGTGNWRISLPVTAADAGGVVMPATYLDNTINWHAGLVNCEYDSNATYVVPLLGSTPSGAVTNTSPFTWNSTDTLSFNGSYEAE